MQVWLSRLPGKAPRLVSLGLSGLIGLEIVHAILSLLPARPRPVAAANRALPGDHAPRAARPSSADVGTIVAAHLFGVFTGDPRGRPDEAPPSAAKLLLLGTIATTSPNQGMAIIASDEPGRVFRVGDSVDGAALREVYATHVILDRDGLLETLSLPRFKTSSSNPAANGRKTNTAGGGKMGDLVRAEPLVDDDSGTLLGFRLRPGAAAASFTRSGLRPGDLMTAVNGTLLAGQDRQRSVELVNTMLSAGSAVVSVLRDGKTSEFTLQSSK